MPSTLCNICKKRSAIRQVRVVQNNREILMNLCDYDYRKLQRQSNATSSFESLFRGSDFFEDFLGGFEDEEAGPTFPQSQRTRQSLDIGEYLSDHAQRLIQEAADAA